MQAIHVVKNVLRWSLISMLCYHTFLGIRDSDRLTFENRIREGLKFCELNFKEYRDTIEGTIEHNRKNWDGTVGGQTIEIMRDISPIIVLAHSQVGAVTSVFLVLNSRIGCLMAALHAIFMMISINTFYL